MTRHPYEAAQDRELARWHGVIGTREMGSKHFRLVLNFDGASLFVTYPTSPSDNARGALNHVSDIRATLLKMGATRADPEVSRTGLRRTPNPTTPRRLRLGERPQGGPSRDPWEPLRTLQNGLDRSGLE